MKLRGNQNVEMLTKRTNSSPLNTDPAVRS